MNAAKRPCLPLCKSVAEAVTLSKKDKDNFYVVALYIQRWLARANKEAVAEYAEKKNPRDRSLQTGSAWRLFGEHFGDLPDSQFCYLFVCMARLTTYDDPVSRCLAEARHALLIEHDCTGDYFGPKTPLPPPSDSPRPSDGRGIKGEGHSAIDLLRRTTERWCDWLDAANHLHVHTGWHQAPIYFDPDIEKRDLAAVGLSQRHYSEMNDWTKAAWHHLHAQFAQQFARSAKWLTVGQAMSSQQKRLWSYHELDTRIIYLWPMLKKHNWTYRDLMNVVRTLITRPNAYPCQREQDFSVHCRTVLGLRKSIHGRTTKNGNPAGYDVAQCLFTLGTSG